MKKISSVILVILLAVVAFWRVFHDAEFMTPVRQKISDLGADGMIWIFWVIIGLLVLSIGVEILWEILSDAHKVIHTGIKGKVVVERVFQTDERIDRKGIVSFYLLHLKVIPDQGETYEATVLQQLRREDLNLFYIGAEQPVKISRDDNEKIYFENLSYKPLGGMVFYDKETDVYKNALETKQELDIRLATSDDPAGRDGT